MSEATVIALSGGVGGAKLVLGLSRVVAPENLVTVTNTGDDFDHFGLRICPDTDTVLYTLSGLSDVEKGWGRANETWTFMQAVAGLGGADWFNLGDGDLALHVLRSERLRQGATLTEVTADVAREMGIKSTILPMTDQPVSTMVETPEGRLAFQEYFVRDQCAPQVTGFTFAGIADAKPNRVLVPLLVSPAAAIVIAPSNPFVSVDPILSVPGLRDMLRNNGAPIVAVSPIVGGLAIKGPAAKMMQELGGTASALDVARYYQGFVDGLIIDEQDAHLADEIAALGMGVDVQRTVMTDLKTRIDLARQSLAFAGRIREGITR